jgi:hypothetical protein
VCTTGFLVYRKLCWKFKETELGLSGVFPAVHVAVKVTTTFAVLDTVKVASPLDRVTLVAPNITPEFGGSSASTIISRARNMFIGAEFFLGRIPAVAVRFHGHESALSPASIAYPILFASLAVFVARPSWRRRSYGVPPSVYMISGGKFLHLATTLVFFDSVLGLYEHIP